MPIKTIRLPASIATDNPLFPARERGLVWALAAYTYMTGRPLTDAELKQAAGLPDDSADLQAVAGWLRQIEDLVLDCRARSDAQGKTGATNGLAKKSRSRTRKKAEAVPEALPEPVPEALNRTEVMTEIDEVFLYWREATGHQRAALDSKRRKLIAQALRLYSVADLCAAVKGCTLSPWHMGANDRNMRYDSLELILRDSGKIDQFIAFAHAPPTKAGAMQSTIDDFLEF